MAQFKNNNFVRDTHDEHNLRVYMCITGIETHGGEVDFRGTLADDLNEHLENMNDIRTGLADEWGEQKGATVLVNLLKAELHDFIIDCRFMLYSMLDEEDLDDVTEADIRKAYGLLVKIPRSVKGKFELARVMSELNAGYIDDGSPYALPAEPFNRLADKGIELRVAADLQVTEILDVYHMNKMLEMERKRGDRLLSRAHKWLVAVWDDNDERLFAFGFVPKSAIWTPGMPEPGEPEPPENWDDAPTNFTVTKTAVGDSIDISCGLHPDADGINIYHSEGPFGDDTVPDRQSTPEWAGAPMPLQVDVEYNMRHWIWVCAVKDGVEGDFAGPLWIEFTETVTPIVPE